MTTKDYRNFESYNLSPELMKTLQSMEYKQATPVQAQTLPPLLRGTDVLVQAASGTGKSAAYGIPMVETIDPHNQEIQGLVVVPTRELTLQVAQIVRDLAGTGEEIRVLALYGGEDIERQFSALRSKPHIIVATPSRLLEHLEEGSVNLYQLSMVVLDETDLLLDMGFLADLNTLVDFLPTPRVSALFTTLLPEEVETLGRRYLINPEEIIIDLPTLTIKTVEQFYAEAEQDEKLELLLDLLDEHQFYLSVVFTNTRRMADRLARSLSRSGYDAAALHGDMRQSARNEVMHDYRTGNLEVLIVTDAASRSVDIRNVAAVINYDIPQDPETYIHRIGRTSRTGETGVAYTLIFPYQRYLLRDIIRETEAEIAPMEGTRGSQLDVDIPEPARHTRTRTRQSRRDYQGKGGSRRGGRHAKHHQAAQRQRGAQHRQAKRQDTAQQQRRAAGGPQGGGSGQQG